MNNQRRFSRIRGLGISLAMVTMLGVTAAAQDANVEGMIIGRSGPMMYVKNGDSPRQIVVLSDSTKATEKGGVFGWSKKDLGVAALVPGLEVKVQGTYDNDHQLVAKKVEFSRSSLKTARQIDAGLNPMSEKMAAAQDELQSHRRDLEAQGKTLDEHGNLIAANAQAEAADKQAIGQTNGRIGMLDQYDTKGSLTVNFKNGSAVVAAKDKEQLEDFVKQAAGTPGFMIQVQGYASKTGSPALNQKLSSERAEAVLSIIQQSGAVPMTRILAPAAMGTSEQVADNHSRSGQAQNRRVVVTVLVNKGITASPDQTTASLSEPASE